MSRNRNLSRREYKELIVEFSKMNENQELMNESWAAAAEVLGPEFAAMITSRFKGLLGGLFGPKGLVTQALKPPISLNGVLGQVNGAIRAAVKAGTTKNPMGLANQIAQQLNAKVAAEAPKLSKLGRFTANGSRVTFQLSGPSSAGSSFAAGVGALSLLAGVGVLYYNVFKWIKEKGTFKQRLSKAIKLSGKGKQPLIRSAADANLSGKMPGGGTQILQGIADNNPLGQTTLLAIEYAIDVPAPGSDGIIGMPMMRDAAEAPAGSSHKNAAMHTEHGDVIIELANEGLIDRNLFAKHYYENFIKPVNEKTKRINANIKELLDNPESEQEEPAADKVGATKSDQFAKYAGNDKIKNALVAAFKKAVSEDGGTLILDKYDGMEFSGDFSSYVKLYKKVKADKNFNPEGGDMSPQFFLNVLKSVFPKKLQGAQEILDNEGVEGINESLSRGSLYRRRYYGRY